MRPGPGRGPAVRVVGVRLVAAALLVTTTACAGSTSPGEAPASSAVPSSAVVALDAAISRLNDTRAAVLADAGLLGAAAAALDEADNAAAAGVLTPAREAVAAVPPGAPTAAQRLPDEVVAYVSALAALERAASVPELEGEVAAALGGLVTAGEAEATAAGSFAAAARRWATYDALAEAQQTWVTRRRAGWYRTEAEAGQAYAVLTGPLRPELATLRPAVAAADSAQAQASRAVAAAIPVASAALEALRRTPTPSG